MKFFQSFRFMLLLIAAAVFFAFLTGDRTASSREWFLSDPISGKALGESAS